MSVPPNPYGPFTKMLGIGAADAGAAFSETAAPFAVEVITERPKGFKGVTPPDYMQDNEDQIAARGWDFC